jgi:outer membrane receptor protein involved in Fe transport
MNRKHLLKSITCLALPLALIPRLTAQDKPTSASSEPTKVKSEEIVELSPFVVSSAEDQGYAAQYTLAGTRIRTDIKDVGSSISVITAKFLQDTNSTNATQLLVYTANTEVVGQGGNFLGIGDAGYAGQVRYGTTRVRGLTSADNTRDFFLSDIPWDSYNVGRVDIQRGPNSILFGIGSPAGIINYSLNHAAFKDSNKIENKVDNYGSVRFSGDFNKVLLDKELSIRISLLDDDTKFRQDPAYRSDKRGYAAMRWDPAFLNKGSMHTSLEASFEKGRIRSNLPRPAPPFDYLTPWFTTLHSLQGRPNSRLQSGPGDGLQLSGELPKSLYGRRVYHGHWRLRKLHQQLHQHARRQSEGVEKSRHHRSVDV